MNEVIDQDTPCNSWYNSTFPKYYDWSYFLKTESWIDLFCDPVWTWLKGADKNFDIDQNASEMHEMQGLISSMRRLSQPINTPATIVVVFGAAHNEIRFERQAIIVKRHLVRRLNLKNEWSRVLVLLIQWHDPVSIREGQYLGAVTRRVTIEESRNPRQQVIKKPRLRPIVPRKQGSRWTGTTGSRRDLVPREAAPISLAWASRWNQWQAETVSGPAQSEGDQHCLGILASHCVLSNHPSRRDDGQGLVARTAGPELWVQIVKREILYESVVCLWITGPSLWHFLLQFAREIIGILNYL